MKQRFRKISTGAALAVTAGVVWGVVEPYTLDVRRFDVTVPYLPQAWRGKEVAVLGDIQLGMWLPNVATVRRAVRRVVEERPAAALLLGDFIYMTDDPQSRTISRAVSLVRPLVEAGIPTFTVLGNHDYHMPLSTSEPNDAVIDALVEQLEAAGVRVLRNEAHALPAPGAEADRELLYIVGLDSHYASRDRGDVALSGVPAEAPRVVLMHHPDSFKQLPAGSAPLAIAGHTHGGQFRPPFNRQWSLMNLIQKDVIYTEGWIDDVGEPGNRLYVNRGLGFSILPLRINAPPEVTFFTLS